MGNWVQDGQTIADILLNKNRHLRVVSTVDLSPRFDFTIFAKDFDQSYALQMKAFDETFGLSVLEDARETPVYVLVRHQSMPVALKSSLGGQEGRVQYTGPIWVCHPGLSDLFPPYQPSVWTFRSYGAADLAVYLERWTPIACDLGMDSLHPSAPIINETGLPGSYDFELVRDPKKGITLLESLRLVGLDLVPALRRVRAIYVDRKQGSKGVMDFKPVTPPQAYPAWEPPAIQASGPRH